MTIYFPDVSGFQAGVNLGGALAVIAKATEGTTYVNPDYVAQKRGARAAGAVLAAYHFLYSAKTAAIAAQAQHAFATVGRWVPLALDVEAEGSSSPTVGDAEAFIDAYRKLGGLIHLVYLPHWYWQDVLGSPSLSGLASRQCALWASAYSTYTDASSGEGWQPYGGEDPAIWQYTDTLKFGGVNCDFNAFRGSHAGQQDPADVAATVTELDNLLHTGSIATPPPPPPGPHGYAHTTDGKTTWGEIAASRGMKPLSFLDEQFGLDATSAGTLLADMVPKAGDTYYTASP